MLPPRVVEPNTLVQNRYLIVRSIGQGGMGAVYEATDTRLGNTVALKQTLVGGAQLDRAFEREARILAGLRHPALPKVMDFFADPLGQFLVMEYIPGDDLARLLERRGAPFGAEEVLRWADQALATLEYLHTHQPPIIHRDIKPHNLKLTPQGELVLLDFGLAKGAASTHSQATNLSSVVGYTPLYGPIEQIQGSGTDPRSDLYALAATLYHLLTGAPPIDALTRAAAVLRRLPDPLRPPRELNPQVPPAVSAVLVRAMALDPADRPASAAALRTELRAALSGAPTATPPIAPTLVVGAGGAAPTIGLAPPARRRSIGRWVAIGLGAAVLVTVMLCLVARSAFTSMFSFGPPAREAAVASPTPRPPRPTFTPRPVTTLTPRPTATPKAETSPVASDLEQVAQYVYGPADGSLAHDQDEFVETASAEVQLRDFVVEVRFYNPFDRARARWDYGLFLRDTGAGQQYRLDIDAETKWTLDLATTAGGETQFATIASGQIDGLNVAPGEYNDIRLIFSGATAFLYANGQYVATLDVSGKQERGDVSIATGMIDGSEINGEATHFENFVVWSLDSDPALLSAARQQGRLVARDDFANNANNWFLGESNDGNAYRTIEGGVMAVNVRKENWVFWETWDARLQNFAAEVDVTPHTEDSGGGIIFGYQDDNHFLYVRLVGEYFILEKQENGTWTTILDWAKHPAIRGDFALNKVLVVRKGASILIYINSVLVGQAHDESYPGGKAGIAASSGRVSDADVDLDNLRIWRLP
jgi:hypothetical protein